MSFFTKSAIVAASALVLKVDAADPKLKAMETFKTSAGIQMTCTADLAKNPSWEKFHMFEGCLYALTNTKDKPKQAADNRISENMNFYSNIGKWVKFLGQYIAPEATKDVDEKKFVVEAVTANGSADIWSKVEKKARDFPRWSFDAEKLGKGGTKDRVVQVVRGMYNMNLAGRSWKLKDGKFGSFDMVAPLNEILSEAQPEALKKHQEHKDSKRS